MCGRLPPGPAGTRLPRITLCPVTRVAPFSHLHKPIAITLHLASRSVTAVTRESRTGRWTKNVRRNTNDWKERMRTGERLGERETLRAGESDLALGEGLLSLPLGSGSLSPSTSIASSSFTTSSTTMSAGSGSGDLDIFLHGVQQYVNCRSWAVMHQQADYSDST